MPEVVLPEPVSPVMSQPRQNSLRFQANPFNRTTQRDTGRNKNRAITNQTAIATPDLAAHELPSPFNAKRSQYALCGGKICRSVFIIRTSRSRFPPRVPLLSPAE